jgi:trans-aconitate methyltransferase
MYTNLNDIANIVLFHKACAKEHGNGSVGALGWTNDEAQLARFAALSGIGDMNNKTVLDVGCGHGDLAPYLHNQFTGCQYTGVDQAPVFLDVAMKRYGQIRNTTFLFADFWSAVLPKADYVLASGALSYRNSNDRFLFDMIDKLFATSNIGLAFNLLSYLDNEDGLLRTYQAKKYWIIATP